jgi:hypothetical protein
MKDGKPNLISYDEERGTAMPTGYAPGAQQQESSLLAPRAAGEQRTTQTGQGSIKHGPEVISTQPPANLM